MINKIEEFNERLNKALSSRNMKPVELSEKTGISESTISQYRSGYAKPKEKKLAIIADALNVSPAWLMGLDVPMEIPPLPIDDIQKISQTVNKEIVEQAMTLYEAFSNATADVQQAVNILLKQFKPVAENMSKLANQIPHLESPKQEQDIPRLKGMKSNPELPHLKKDKE